MSDYQRGLNGLPPLDDTNLGQWNQGKADRDRGVVPSGPWGDATDVMKDEFGRGRIRFYVRWLVQSALLSVVVGGIAAGIAVLSKKSPDEVVTWALIGAGATAAFCLILLAAFTVGVLLGVAINIATLPLLLWRWLLGFAILGAGAGYLSATAAGATTAVAQQRAVEYAIVGLLVGLVLGTLFRIIRRLRRRAPQT